MILKQILHQAWLQDHSLFIGSEVIKGRVLSLEGLPGQRHNAFVLLMIGQASELLFEKRAKQPIGHKALKALRTNILKLRFNGCPQILGSIPMGNRPLVYGKLQLIKDPAHLIRTPEIQSEKSMGIPAKLQ